MSTTTTHAGPLAYWFGPDGNNDESLFRGRERGVPDAEQIQRRVDTHPAAWELIRRGIRAAREQGIAR